MNMANALANQTGTLALFITTWRKMGIEPNPVMIEAIKDFSAELEQQSRDVADPNTPDDRLVDLVRIAIQKNGELVELFREEVEKLHK